MSPQDATAGPDRDPSRIEYRLVQTAADGSVTVTNYKIDPKRLGMGDIRVAGTP
ncbi:hypothetical protein [Actinoplanes awajinensis]|uniref:hypothetical protein n=1 Tax=Actinoplanes awajinensis TaxID=135946 RepID=UPI000B01923A|nr:hypothetical protein [Actinoplanes awajinensis]